MTRSTYIAAARVWINDARLTARPDWKANFLWCAGECRRRALEN